MAESEGIQAILNQIAIQAVTAVLMVLRDTNAWPRTAANTASLRQPPRYMTDQNCFKMEIMNILKTKTYDLADEEKFLVIRNWLDRDSLYLIKL